MFVAQVIKSMKICNIFQFVRDITVTLLGLIWLGRSHGIRVAGHQELHSFLGYADVWLVQCHQYHCAAEHVDCHDEQFVSNHFGELHVNLVGNERSTDESMP